MNLIHIKLKNGEDILAQEDPLKSEFGIRVTAPISVHLDPIHGFFAKSWLALSSANTVIIDNNDIMFLNPASDKGFEYYEEFVKRIVSDDDVDPDEVDELEQMFEAMLQSKSSKLH